MRLCMLTRLCNQLACLAAAVPHSTLPKIAAIINALFPALAAGSDLWWMAGAGIRAAELSRGRMCEQGIMEGSRRGGRDVAQLLSLEEQPAVALSPIIPLYSV